MRSYFTPQHRFWTHLSLSSSSRYPKSWKVDATDVCMHKTSRSSSQPNCMQSKRWKQWTTMRAQPRTIVRVLPLAPTWLSGGARQFIFPTCFNYLYPAYEVRTRHLPHFENGASAKKVQVGQARPPPPPHHIFQTDVSPSAGASGVQARQVGQVIGKNGERGSSGRIQLPTPEGRQVRQNQLACTPTATFIWLEFS